MEAGDDLGGSMPLLMAKVLGVWQSRGVRGQKMKPWVRQGEEL